MVEFDTQTILATGSWGLITAASVIAFVRQRGPATSLQLAGSATFFVASVMNYMRLYHLDATRHIQPAWLWRLQGWMLVAGTVVFAVGHLLYWAKNRGRIAS